MENKKRRAAAGAAAYDGVAPSRNDAEGRVAALDPADAAAISAAVGEAAYEWDLATDILSWSPNAGEVLGVETLESIGAGGSSPPSSIRKIRRTAMTQFLVPRRATPAAALVMS